MALRSGLNDSPIEEAATVSIAFRNPVWPVCRVAAFAIGLFGLSAPAAFADCAPQTRDGERYVVCAFDVLRDDVRLYWRDADGKPFRGFDALAEALKTRGRALRFAMNAGMFEEDGSPVGLYVEDGKRLHRVDRSRYQSPIRSSSTSPSNAMVPGSRIALTSGMPS